MAYEDLSGLKYPHFEVLEPIYKDYKGQKKLYWKCKCECGTIFYATKTHIKTEKIKSCGCLEKENRKEQNNKLQDMILEDTNVSLIRKTEPNKNTTTGIRGVSWCTSKQKYIATITFQKKQYYLCSSTDIEVCKSARKEAEEHIFGDFLKWYEENINQ